MGKFIGLLIHLLQDPVFPSELEKWARWEDPNENYKESLIK
jgi:hypothetical protein